MTGTVLGLVPHVLHHAGLIAGVALLTGAGGNAVLFVVGLLFSFPLLRRLYRRFQTWRAPAVAIVVFAAAFSLSAFVIGPAIGGGARPPDTPPVAPAETTTADHDEHHGG